MGVSLGSPVVSLEGAPVQQASSPFWQSKTFWGILLGFALPLVKKNFHFTDIDTDSLADILATLGGAISSGFAIFGRARATGPLTIANKPPAQTG